MRFDNPAHALEWLTRYREGATIRRSDSDRIKGCFDDAQVAAADLSNLLDQFPRDHQRALIEIATIGKAETLERHPHYCLFASYIWKRFHRLLEEVGYLGRHLHRAA
jgi:predicted TPR repeat methyltransferase